MTEAEWLRCYDPSTLLAHLRSRQWHHHPFRRRKMRLFGCACVRRVWRFLNAEGQRQLEMAEELAEGLRPQPTAEEAPPPPFLDRLTFADSDGKARAAAFLAQDRNAGTAAMEASRVALWVFVSEIRAGTSTDGVQYQEIEEQRRLVHEIAGNPFQPPDPVPARQDREVARLARAAYEERELPSGHLDNARLSILSDALEEAGSTDETLLDHLRSAGPHVRGCWALDLLLVKR